MMCHPSTWCELWTVYFINFCPLLNTMSYIFYLTDFWTTESSLDNNVDHRPEPALQTGQWRLGLQLRWIFTSLQMLCCRKLIKKSQNSLLSRPTSTSSPPTPKHHLIPVPWHFRLLRKSGWWRHFKPIIWTLKLTEAHPCQPKTNV